MKITTVGIDLAKNVFSLKSRSGMVTELFGQKEQRPRFPASSAKINGLKA